VHWTPTQSSAAGVNDGDVGGKEKMLPSSVPCLSNVATNSIIDWQKDGQEQLTEFLLMLLPLWK